MRIATWNINSVRLRINQVRRFLRNHQPDVLCLQETKVPDEKFPRKSFKDLGYTHIALNGQKGYHGVATVSRIPFTETFNRGFCGKSDARHTAVSFEDGITLHNFYVPAGGDLPDPDLNEKFAHKLAFLDEAAAWFETIEGGEKARHVLVGDLNVAPLEHDVWSHKQLLKVVSHTPIEVSRLETLQASAGWIDVTREAIPEPEKVFTWWSYRSPDWKKSDRGRRLDHIWVTPALAPAVRSVSLQKETRSWKQPSDHIPVMVDLAAGT